MSAQLSQHVTTRLLVAEKSENSAYELESILRDAGIATKLTISDDLAHIGHLLSKGEVDIALLTNKLAGLEQFLPRLREQAPHTPIILLNSADTESWSVSKVLQLGATDMVAFTQPDHLTQVVKRELEHVCQREHFAQVRLALNEAEQRCQLLLQGSRAAIAYVHEGMHIHANEGYLDLFGYTDVDDLYAASLVDILSQESADQLKTQLKALRNGTSEVVFDFAGKSQQGNTVKGSMTLTNSQYEGEDCLQVTVRKAAPEPSTEQTKAPAEYPPEPVEAKETLELSGFIKNAESLFEQDTGDAYMLAGGIDDFSSLQPSYGLVGTESICRRIWQAIKDFIPQYPATRISNHQFAIAINAESYEQACTVADQLRIEISELMFEVQDKTVRPSISVSGVFVTENDSTGESLDNAYAALLELVESEQTNVAHIPSIAEESEGCRSDDARVVLRHINDAIDKNSFVLLFQPIISLRGDSDEHYEVFLRMSDDSGDLIEPGHFLQVAIDNNVAGKIDRWVILQSIKMLSIHRAKGHTTRLTINLTCNSVMDPEFLQWLGVAIKAARLPSDAVVFQITEKDAITYLRQTGEFVLGLRSMHCRTSLSRFGLIDDPFETLKHLPVDMVKLDGACVSMLKGNEDRLILMIEKLQAAGKLTIVPMVENTNVLSTLWQAGANYIQGHYLQEPSTEMDYDFSTEE